MFPPLPPLPLWLSGISPVLLAILGSVFFLTLNYAGRDPFYWALNWFLEANVPFFRATGELISLVDVFVKGCGIYFFADLVGVSILPTPLGSTLVLTLPIFAARHWVYPSAFKAVTTVSRMDDIIFVQDILLRTVGVYQLLFWGLTGYRLF
jgi:hypothetical protein